MSALKWDICHPVPSKAQSLISDKGAERMQEAADGEESYEMSSSGWDTTVALKFVAAEVTCARSSRQNPSVDGEGLSRPLA